MFFYQKGDVMMKIVDRREGPRTESTRQLARRSRLHRRRLAIELLEARHLLSGFEAHYDFGPVGSQVASGFELVTLANPMWQAGEGIEVGSEQRQRFRKRPCPVGE